MSTTRTMALAALLVTSVMLAGCGKSAQEAAPTATTETSASGHTHGGWWCAEHGVPEEVCALCSTKIAADFKAKGDWCTEHDRPESQCFICHPEKEAEFAALYEAKYGEKPPHPTAEGEAHDHPHDHDHDHAEG